MDRRGRLLATALAGAMLAGAGIAQAAKKPAAPSTPYGKLAWRSIGPAAAGGRVTSVSGSAQDPNLYYLGAAGGGVWKSSNGGATWKPVFNTQKVAAIGAVAIDPTNENVVWVGTGESNPRNDVSYGDGIYKTTNGGKTWKRVGLQATRHISRIVVDPHHPNHVIVSAAGSYYKNSTSGGIYVTWNGGKTWKQTLYLGPKTGGSDLAIDPSNPLVVYAGMWEFRRKPWTFRSGGKADGLFKSIDGGKSWRRLAGNGLPPGLTGRIGLAVAPSNPNFVYALIEAKGGILWRSEDAGAHWKMVSDNTLVDQRPFYFTHVAVDPKNPKRVYGVSEMLSLSKNGGKTFKAIAKNVHVDYHAIWIAPNNPKRIIVGEDGGYALTLDGGKAWSFSRNLAIGQVYHVGLSGGNPYLVCGAFQDNNAWCGPSNSLDPAGNTNAYWYPVIGGDGMWSVPVPGNRRYVVSDLEDGVVAQYDRRTGGNRFIDPVVNPTLSLFHLYRHKYRFNWDSPVAFSPWSPHVLWYGGNVVFQSSDLGVHWTVISPDLTLNIKAHQQAAGGPLAHDVSGAEYSDTILDIEGSPRRAGEIWVGTDDGLVQRTLNDGKTWTNVTPPGLPPFGRVETVAPSALNANTVYVSIDRHRSGDDAPYVFVSHNDGASWTKIVNGLPPDQYVRTVRPDIINPNLVYAGTEEGMWISYNGGKRWSKFQLNLPTASVRDIRLQPTFDDLVVATHGRAMWILDDLTSLQMLPQAKAAGSMLFPVRTAYEYIMRRSNEGNYTRFSGQNPPYGAILDFYQKAPQKKSPTVDILNARGRIIRHIGGTHKMGKKKVPNVTNVVGINRVVWDFRTDGPIRWMGAARKEFRGPKEGAMVPPGRYTARIVLNGKTYTQPFTVKPDPRTPYTQADFEAAYRFARKYLRVYGKVDSVLNALDAQKASLLAARASASKAGETALAAQIDAANAKRSALFHAFTANYHNDEDFIQRPGKLREKIPAGFFFAAMAPPTAATLTYARKFNVEYRAAMAEYNGYVGTVLKPVAAAVRAARAGMIRGVRTVAP
ncbi:MAG: WD40/YVTN/BNR-like repeat-containing protein [Vulcanimicrobiaceae bacterium]